MASPSFKLGTKEYNIERPRDGSLFGTTNLPCNFLTYGYFYLRKSTCMNEFMKTILKKIASCSSAFFFLAKGYD